MVIGIGETSKSPAANKPPPASATQSQPPIQNFLMSFTQLTVNAGAAPPPAPTPSPMTSSSAPEPFGRTIRPLTNGIYFLSPESFLLFDDKQNARVQIKDIDTSQEFGYEVQGTAIQLKVPKSHYHQHLDHSSTFIIDPSAHAMNVDGAQYSFLPSQPPQDDRIYQVRQSYYSESAVKQLMIFNKGRSFVANFGGEMFVGSLNTTKSSSGILVSQGTISSSSTTHQKHRSSVPSALNMRFFGILILIDSREGNALFATAN